VNRTERLVADYVLSGGEFIPNAAVDIGSDGRITAVGANLPATRGPVKNVGGLLMPGLVNAHAHTPMTLVRSAGDGLELRQWLQDGVWPREGKMNPDDARAGMLLGSAEMLLAGVTTSCEMYLFEEALVDAAHQSKARLVITPGIIAALSPGGDVSGRLGEIDQFFDEHHNPGGRITVGYGPHSLYDLSPDQLSEVHAHAHTRNALVHIHLEETRFERQEVIEKWTGQTATELLQSIGLLDGRLLVAHGVWLSESDQQLIADAAGEIAVAHCPQSNLKLGSGIAPIAAMRAKGITVGVGTDGPASNDNLDLWEETRLAPLLARGAGHDATAMSAKTALSLATADAARAVGLNDVGDLQPNMWADISRVDLDGPAFAVGLEEDLASNLVFAASSSVVSDVWVAGERVVENRQCLTVDVAEAVADIRVRGQRLARTP